MADRPISHAELADAVAARPRFRHLWPGLSGVSHTLLKPFAWQGDICFGPLRDGQLTFQSPQVSPHWTGLPPLEDAGPRAVLAYLSGYGPTTRAHLHYWLVAGLSAGRKRLDGWLDGLIGNYVAEIQVEGEPMLHLRNYVEDLAAQAPSARVTLLPGHDQWVLGAGTADRRIVPSARRSAITLGAPLILHAGVVAGTWKLATTHLAISWFNEAGSPPRAQIEVEAARLAQLLDAEYDVTVTET